MIVKLLTEHNLEFLSLKGGCTVSSDSTLVKKPHCWQSHVAAHFIYLKMQWHKRKRRGRRELKEVEGGGGGGRRSGGRRSGGRKSGGEGEKEML